MSVIMSADMKYRYRLSRNIGSLMYVGGTVCFIMLNPSTADERNDDPTIRRCKSFGARLRCAKLEVVNLFALRATNPQELYRHGSGAVGPDNDQHIAEACNVADIIICAWGNLGSYLGRDKDVLNLIRVQGRAKPQALKINVGTGQPTHPLYVKADSLLIFI